MNVEQAAPAYFAIIPASVLHDKELPPSAKLLYGEISALSHKNGECWPTNAYFRQLYNVDESSVRRWIRLLVKRGYITMRLEYIEGTKAVSRRVLSPAGGGCKNTPSGGQNCTQRGGKNAPQNNTSNNKYIGEQAPKRFVPPSVDEVRAYCEQRHNGIDPEYFVNYYAARGWMMGRTHMKDWKKAVITWETRNKAKAGAGGEELAYI